MLFDDILSSSILHPRGDIRYDHAVYLCSRAWAFLLCHEIGHIVRCHLPYLRERGLLAKSKTGASMLMEFDECSGDDICSVRRILECDADSMAVRIQVEGYLSQTLSEHSRMTFGPKCTVDMRWEDVAYHWMIAVGVLFQLMWVRDVSRIIQSARTHPHPDTRLYVLANFAWSSWKKVIPSLETYNAVIYKAILDLLQIWKSLKLPLSSARKLFTYESDLRKDFSTFQKGFEKVSLRLHELAMLRAKQGNSTS